MTDHLKLIQLLDALMKENDIKNYVITLRTGSLIRLVASDIENDNTQDSIFNAAWSIIEQDSGILIRDEIIDTNNGTITRINNPANEN